MGAAGSPRATVCEMERMEEWGIQRRRLRESWRGPNRGEREREREANQKVNSERSRGRQGCHLGSLVDGRAGSRDLRNLLGRRPEGERRG